MPNQANRSGRRFFRRWASQASVSAFHTPHAVALSLAAGTVVASVIFAGGSNPQGPGATPVESPMRPGYLVCMRVGQPYTGSTASAAEDLPATGFLVLSRAELRQASARGSRPRSMPSPAPTEEPSATLPAPTPTPTEAPRGIITYQVAPGDTLNSLAERFGVSVETIVWANDLPAGAMLQAGQSLTIPPVSGVLYTVEKGDSLQSIGAAYEVSAEVIAAANGLDPAAVLSIGQQLVIPGARPLAPEPTETVAPTATPTAEPQPTATEEAPATATAPESADKGQEIAGIAARYLGYPYTWAGSSPQTGFDCSGFTWYVYSQAGVAIPNHDLWGQLGSGPAVERSALLPGDLVFFVNTYKAGLSHAGIYAGNGRFIHAATAGAGVRYDRLDDAYWSARYYAASRP